jgi:hypothetical protein
VDRACTVDDTPELTWPWLAQDCGRRRNDERRQVMDRRAWSRWEFTVQSESTIHRSVRGSDAAFPPRGPLITPASRIPNPGTAAEGDRRGLNITAVVG